MTDMLPQMSIKAIIMDLDNCLWDSTMLDQYLPADHTSREQWRTFEVHYPEVIPHQWGISLVNAYRAMGYCILFVTSREDVDNCKGTTISSIHKALDGNLNNIWLFMRRAHERGESQVVKQRIYNDEIKGNFDVELAIDDDAKNCEMFTRLGIPTLQKILKKEI